MKKTLLLGAVVSSILICKISYAEVFQCDPKFHGKPFVQATIWSNTDGFGSAECDYKYPEEQGVISYRFPKDEQYYVVSGNWQSTMPGFQWCSTENGNTYATCRFARR